MKQKKVVKIVVLLALLIGLGFGIFFVFTQSVVESPGLSICYSTYGVEPYNFAKASILGYSVATATAGGSVSFGSSSYSWTYGDPRPIAGCGCGSIKGDGSWVIQTTTMQDSGLNTIMTTSGSYCTYGSVTSIPAGCERRNPVFYSKNCNTYDIYCPKPSTIDGKQFGGTNTATSYWCGCSQGAINFPLAFVGGKLVDYGVIDANKATVVNDTETLKNADLVVSSCYAMTSQTDRGTAYNGKCTFAVNIPNEKVGLVFDNDRLMTFVGNDLIVPLYLENNWTKDLYGTLTIQYLVETPFGNATKEVVFNDFVLPVGGKGLNITVPTENVAEFLYFKAKFSTYFKNGVHYSGIPASCHYGSAMLESIPVKDFDTGWQRVVVNPKPLYLPVPADGSCVSLDGYELNKDKTFCIRDDIADLGCMQVGCPVFENLTNEYFCTSAGVCAEMVYKQGCRNDSDCEDFGAVCLDSAFDEETKFCVKTEISEIIKEIPTPVYVSMTCDNMNFMCAEGFECVDWDVNGTKYATCQKETITSNVSDLTWMLIIGVVFLVIVVVVVLIFRKKGKKRK